MGIRSVSGWKNIKKSNIPFETQTNRSLEVALCGFIEHLFTHLAAAWLHFGTQQISQNDGVIVLDL